MKPNPKDIKKYKITFTVSDGRFMTREIVEIRATREESACHGAFKTKVYPKYQNMGCRFFVDKVEIINE